MTTTHDGAIDLSRAMPGAQGVRAPGHRLPDATRIGRVRLDVADLDRSVPYYRDVLGFQVAARTEHGGEAMATLTAHGDDTPLIELHQRPGARAVPRTGRLGLYHFAILLPDRAALGRFIAHLAQIGAYAGMSDHLVSEAVYLRDPDGLGIEVYADRTRESWRWASGELTMTTEALDARSVVAAAHGEPWTGMPAGTTVGHVHLHVGDLRDAAAFYHAALGLDAMVWSYPGALFLAAGGYHHHLGLNTWAAGAPSAGEGDARLREWELLVPDRSAADAAARSLTEAGYADTRDGADVIAADPWGTTLRIVPGSAIVG